MTKAASGRDKRLASALRDNLRRRKQASRPGENPPAENVAAEPHDPPKPPHGAGEDR